ncbi:MAG: hypothetical protein OES84_05000 [Kiritimatiellaceae bacterium]|nr:hypothetical protein [Kiritimatiellaceae bacterium]
MIATFPSPKLPGGWLPTKLIFQTLEKTLETLMKRLGKVYTPAMEAL